MYFSCDGIFHLSCHISFLNPQAYFTSIFSLPAHSNSLGSLAVFPEHNAALPHGSSFSPQHFFYFQAIFWVPKCPFNTAPHQTHSSLAFPLEDPQHRRYTLSHFFHQSQLSAKVQHEPSRWMQ